MKYYSMKSIRVFFIAFIILSVGIVATLYLNTNKMQIVLEASSPTTTIDGVEVITTEQQFALNEQSVEASLTNTTTPNYYCLRDELAIFTQNQSTMGLCWNFSANTVLESLLAREYGEYYDLADAYNGITNKFLNSSYVIGAGGNMYYWDNLYAQYGVVLETDLPYENIFGINSSNYSDMYETIKDYSFKLPKTILYVNFKNYNSAEYSSQRDTIIASMKQHLMTESAITVSVYANEIAYNGYTLYFNSVDQTVNHGVTIIGWDDNFTYIENGNTHTGAWIVLNSYGNTWGNHGIFYMPYDEASLESMYGLTFSSSQAESDVTITDSNSAFTNNYVGKFAYTSNVDTTPNTVAQKNLFYTNQDIDLTYTYSSTYSDYDVNAYFVDKGNESYANFTLKVDENNHTIDVDSRDNSTDAGTYVLRIDFDFNNDSVVDNSVYKEIFVFNGLEIGSIIFRQLEYKNAEHTTIGSNYSEPYLYNFNSYNNNTTDFELATDDEGFLIMLEFSSYSQINSYSASGTGFHLSQNSTSYTGASNGNFANGKLYVFCYGTPNITGTITLKNTTLNASVTYNFNLTITDTRTYETYIIYDLDGGYFTDDTMTSTSYIYQTDNKIYLDTPKKLNYDFAGFYSDDTFSSEISKDENGYYLTYRDGLFNESGFNNYSDNLFSDNGGELYRLEILMTVYAKWEVPNNTLSYQSITEEVQYGNEINIDLPTMSNGSGNYDIYLSYAPSTINLTDNVIQGTITTIDNYSLYLNIRDIDNYYYYSIPLNINVIPREIEITIDNKNSDYGQPLVALSGSITNGSIYGSDELNIEYSTTATDTSNAGTYEIVGQYSNDNYNVTFIKGTYTINKTTLPLDKYTLQNYENTYDSNAHNASFEYISNENPTIEYSIDNQEYTSTAPTFTDAGEHIYYIRLSNFTNYTDTILTASVIINPIEINVIWSNTELKYNGETLFPTFELENSTSEEFEIIKNGGSIIPSDNLTASLSLENDVINYKLTNASCIYSIANADFEVTYDEYADTYDNAYHTIDFQVVSTPNTDYTISHSLDGIQYTNGNYSFKDAQNTKIYIKISAPYFNDYTFETNITVNKYAIDIIWGERNLIYDGTKKTPTYTYSNPFNEELEIMQLDYAQDASHRTLNLVLQGDSNKNYTLNNASCDYIYINSNISVSAPAISQSQVNSAETLNDITLPENYRWANPNQSVEFGKNQYELIYTTEEGTEESLYITIDKPESTMDWLYIVIAGVCVVIAIILLIFAIRSKKKESAFEPSYNVKADKKAKKSSKVEDYISQSKLSKSNDTPKDYDKNNINQSFTQNQSTQINSSTTPTQTTNSNNTTTPTSQQPKPNTTPTPNKPMGGPKLPPKPPKLP